MAAGTFYLDADDEITSAAARIRSSNATKVGLVVPYGSRISTSRMNFRLLSREAVVNNRRLSIIAADPATRALAASAGLPVFATVAEYEAALAGPPAAPPDDDDGAVVPAPVVPAEPVDDAPRGKGTKKRPVRGPADDATQAIVLPPTAAAATGAASARMPVPQPPSPGAAGTKLRNRSLPFLSKYSIRVLPLCAVAARAPLPSGWSTSVNTAPKPLTVAGAVPLVPGMEKDASVMLLPTGVNNRDRLNVLKILA